VVDARIHGEQQILGRWIARFEVRDPILDIADRTLTSSNTPDCQTVDGSRPRRMLGSITWWLGSITRTLGSTP